MDVDGWHLFLDATDKLDLESERELERMKERLSKNMGIIKLPELLIEVDNELKITRCFMPPPQQYNVQAAEICAILATIIAHGSNIGACTMSHLTGISYNRIKHITYWMFTDEALRRALDLVVNEICNLNITNAWGKGRTSSSDGQRFALKCKVPQ